MTECLPGLTQPEQALLDAAAAILTPGGNGFPTAREADPDATVLAIAWAHLHSQHSKLRSALEFLGAREPVTGSAMQALSDEHSEWFEALRTLLVARYLTCRPVWSCLRYPGHVPSPPQAGEADKWLRGGLLDSVLSRGKIYR